VVHCHDLWICSNPRLKMGNYIFCYRLLPDLP